MTPHLGGHVRAYVDRSLPPAILHLYDRHLVACMVCRAAADQERRIMAALRSDSCGLPGSLRSSLMSLAASPVPEPPAPMGPRIPLGPLSPLAVRGLRSWEGAAMPSSAPGSSRGGSLTTVAPSAPPLHRSPMRAAVVASLAAGASVAAAWGLAVAPLPGGTRPPAVRLPSGVASVGAVNYGAVMPSLPSSTTTGASRSASGARPSPLSVLSSSRGVLPTPSPSTPVRISLVSSAQSGP